jgi:hypothetical protein
MKVKLKKKIINYNMITWEKLERDKVYTNSNRSMYYKILDLTENYGVKYVDGSAIRTLRPLYSEDLY